MRWFPRILIVLAVLASGLALIPYVDLRAERFGWQLYAQVYGPTPYQVSIENFAFVPDTIVVPVGATVRWTNNDATDHTVTSSAALFDSGVLEPGGQFERRFDEVGTYPYICSLHPEMEGMVVVEELAPGPSENHYLPIIMRSFLGPS
jgi:plastocyanin